MKTDWRDSGKVESVPDGHRSGADGAGAGTLSSSKRAHTVAVAIPGQGPLAGGHHTHLIQFFFHLLHESNFITFCPKCKVGVDVGGSK